MKGLVLCGGNSSRMGTDKGLLREGDTTWAQLAGDKLSALGLPVMYAVNSHQQQAYKENGISPLLIDADIAIGGPLKGILTAHLLYPAADWLVLACDLRDMHTDVLTHLYKAFNNSTTVYEMDGQDEPLCGIYTNTDLAALAAATLSKHSMRYVLGLCEAERLSVPDDWRAYFHNYNKLDNIT